MLSSLMNKQVNRSTVAGVVDLLGVIIISVTLWYIKAPWWAWFAALFFGWFQQMAGFNRAYVKIGKEMEADSPFIQEAIEFYMEHHKKDKHEVGKVQD